MSFTRPASPAGVLRLCLQLNISAAQLISIARSDKQGAEFIRQAAAAPNAQALMDAIGQSPSELAIIASLNTQAVLTLLDGVIEAAKKVKP